MQQKKAHEPSPEIAHLIDDITASPTPYHAVARASQLLDEAGFSEVERDRVFPSEPGNYFVVDGGTLIAWIQPKTWSGFTIVGAHTDSPNLRVRRNPDIETAGFGQVGVEIYGGVLLNSWIDRDLGVAGRTHVRTNDGIQERLVLDDQPVLRIPQLAIHLDQSIKRDGLKLDAQKHMVPIWTTSPSPDRSFRSYVAELADCSEDDLVSWDLMAFDTQKPTVAGRDKELFVSARIDNLFSSFAGVRALCSLDHDARLDGQRLANMPVLALFDHEEVGSTSATGADGSYLVATLERIALAGGQQRQEFLAAMAASFVLSADGAHATHPNYASKHDPSHPIRLNQGVVIKKNANHRYATEARGESAIIELCNQADIPHQFYVHRNDLRCGSTIGPATAAQLGATTADIGAPQLAMHSIRETAGVEDFAHLCALMRHCWTNQP